MNFSFRYWERNIFYIVLEKHSYLGRSLKSSFSANDIFLTSEQDQCNLFVQQDGVQSTRWSPRGHFFSHI